MISNVLTVCHGNLCRSPVAAALLRHRTEGLHVHSAGLSAVVGQPAATDAVAVLSEIGIDIRGHRATQMTLRLANDADLILTMTAGQKQSLESLYPLMRGRVFSICDFDNADIEDPMGLSISAFRRCREALIVGIDHWVARLDRLNGRSVNREDSGVYVGRGER
ncbi:arsenate reductase/protein-tyrosine-phosphatase family protein [Paraburkholderia terricola]|uniref:protein-tyrosine-phosphatase n=1 Tax=Paraburkholderia terricola TaxID=169427 RepID=A0ABU1LK63_9BURK|nr:low molecular weight phosphotyrosine protein phosphatase [Paraburkholderia terricola]MDR6407095.1 protein-tyrosine phosphatase [Paraburkholderia terricola]MDR6479227.1 protein-tyrosine phosphatase [Paraburkholderia terricola]